MSERERPDQPQEGMPLGEQAPVDPIQQALQKFDQAAGAEKYSKDLLQRGINGVQRAGNKFGKSPGEMYATLAGLNGRAREAAENAGETKDAQLFGQKAEQFRVAGELKDQLILPNQGINPAGELIVPNEGPVLPKRGRRASRKSPNATDNSSGSKW